MTLPVRTADRGTEVKHKAVRSIVNPTNVYYSPGGECCRTSKKCMGFAGAIGNGRSCVCCVQQNG